MMRRSRAPRGARGLKFRRRNGGINSGSRAPRGARGLKSILVKFVMVVAFVVPLAGHVD